MKACGRTGYQTVNTVPLALQSDAILTAPSGPALREILCASPTARTGTYK